ncbi:MAG: TlpA disulfide reductase family protein [Actinomycetota bacterium]
MRSTRSVSVAIVFLVVLLIAASCTGDEQPIGEPVAIDGPLPAVEGKELPDGEFAPADYEGSVTVVNFWATWCVPCRNEQPVLQDIWETYRGRGVTFIGVNHRDDPAAASEWLREYDVTYPSVLDEDGAYAAEFGFTGLPATFIADADGQLRFAFFGEVMEAEDLTRVIDEVLTEPTAT